LSALELLTDARKAGVVLILEGNDIIARTKGPLPADVLALLKGAKPELLRVLACREMAEAALASERPIGATNEQWSEALDGLRRFLDEGWGDRAVALAWPQDELYRVPERWARVDLCGAALLIGRWLVIDVTVEAISVRPPWSSAVLKFRRRMDVGRTDSAQGTDKPPDALDSSKAEGASSGKNSTRPDPFDLAQKPPSGAATFCRTHQR
jgi:hypothetical protein